MKIVLPEIESDVSLRLDSQPHIFQNAKRWKDVCELKGPPNPQLGPKSRRKRGDVLAFKKNAPLCRTVLPRNHVEESGFSCTIRADNRFECKRWDLKADMIDRDVAAKANG